MPSSVALQSTACVWSVYRDVFNMLKMGRFAMSLDQKTGHVGTKLILNNVISEYGKVVDLNIDTKSKCIDATLLLHGENEPMSARIDEYEVTKTNSSAAFLVKAASSERAWLDAVLKNCIVGRSWNVPAKAIPHLDDFLGCDTP